MPTKAQKIKMTIQRRVILQILRDSKVHPTADELYEMVRRRLPKISLGTVYRNLNFLRDQGLVREVRSHGDTSSRFEAELPPHAHFHCTECQTVVDLPLPQCLQTVTWEGDSHVATIKFIDLHVIGACTNCNQPAPEPAGAT